MGSPHQCACLQIARRTCLFGTLVIVMATSQRSMTSGSVRCRVLPQDRHKTWVHVPDHIISPLMISSDPAQVFFPCCQRRWEPSARTWQYGTPTAQVIMHITHIKHSSDYSQGLYFWLPMYVMIFESVAFVNGTFEFSNGKIFAKEKRKKWSASNHVMAQYSVMAL